MPKEIVQFNSFNGATPAVPDSGAIGFKNVRVDGSESIAIPENKDKPMNTSYVQEKNLFVEGKTIPISEDQKGRIFVDNKLVGIVSPPRGDRLCMDVIGRQASIIDDDGHVKYLRYGYGNGNLIDIEKDEIIFEEDIVSSDYNYANAENIQFMVPINEEYFLYAQYGYNGLFLYDRANDEIHCTGKLCSTSPIAWCYDKVEVDTDIFRPAHIYFAHYEDNRLFITKLNIEKLFDPNINSTTIEWFENISINSSGVIANIEVIETLNPPGSRLDSIAVSHDYVFLGYNMGRDTPISELDLEDDFLFSFDKDLFVYDTPKLISYDSGDLHKSKLPFIPYKRIPVRDYYYASIYRRRKNTSYYDLYDCGGYVGPSPGYSGYFRIPYEVTVNSQPIMNYTPNTNITTEAGFYDVFKKLESIYSTATISYNPDGETHFEPPFGWNSSLVCMESPGNCGFAHVGQNEEDDVLLIGSLVIVDYDNNIVGYEIACPSKVWMNQRTEHEYITIDENEVVNPDGNPHSHNGCGVTYWRDYKTFYEDMDELQIGIDIRNIPFDKLYKDEDVVYFDSQNTPQDIYYCWNGVEPTNTWDYQFFNLWLGANHPHCWWEYIGRFFHLTKFFNNPEVESDGSARFALFASELENHAGNHYNQRTHYSLNDTDSKTLLTPSNNDVAYLSEIDSYDNAIDLSYSMLLVADLWNTNVDPYNTYKMFNLPRNTMMLSYANKVVVYEPDMSDIPDYIDLTLIREIEYKPSTITFTEINGSAFESGKSIRYRIAFVYDGVCISPLTDHFWDHTVSNGESNKNIVVNINTNIELLHVVSRRITGLRLYAAEIIEGTEQELYRLVKEIEFDTHTFMFNSETGLYYAQIVDDGTRYASFNIDAGYSETMKNVSAKRKCQCVYNGMIFAGNVSFPLDPKVNVNTDNLVIRSLPYQPSVFNYQEEYCVLGFIPIALIPFNGRIYAFGDEEYAIINADTLAIEYTSRACGIAHRSHAVVTDYGIFVYYNNNLYAIDGNKIVSVGDAIKENNYAPTTGEAENFPSFKWLNRRIFVDYLQNRNAIVVIGETADATKYQDIIIFAYSLSTGKWVIYTIDTPSNFDIVNLEGEYATEDGSVVVTVSTDIETAEEPIEPINPINPPNLKGAVIPSPGGQLSSSRLSTRPYSGNRYLTTYVSSQKLFSIDQVYYKDKNRTMELDYVIDFGTKNKKQIYDIQTYNGNTRVESEIYIDNKPASDYYNNMIAKSVFRISIKTNKPISMIKYVIRTFVVKEER